MMYFFKKPQKGFTLIETLVAIAIVSITLVAPFYAVEQSLSASYTARDQLTASMLAQEGIEYVREIRDDNYLTNYKTPGAQSWMYRLDGSGGSTSCFVSTGGPNRKCMVDPTQNPAKTGVIVGADVQVCPQGNCSPLSINTSPTNQLYNFYNQQADLSNVTTKFTRSISLCYTSPTEACDPTLHSSNEVQVTSTVSWITQNAPHTTQVIEYLQNTN